jgi:hypothetical protein
LVNVVRELAPLALSEKLTPREKLREHNRVIAASGLRKTTPLAYCRLE